MQINNVGYNNYGYSNQKAQKNKNQQSFGMAQGATLIQCLEQNATKIQTQLPVTSRAALGRALGIIDRHATPVEEIGDRLLLRDGNRARMVGTGTGNISDQATLAVKDLEKLDQLKGEASFLAKDQALVPQLETELEKFDREAVEKLRKGEITLEADIAASDVKRGEHVEAIRVAKTQLENSTKAQAELDKFFPAVLNSQEIESIERAEKEIAEAKAAAQQAAQTGENG